MTEAEKDQVTEEILFDPIWSYLTVTCQSPINMGTDSLIIYTQDCIKLYGFILSFENQGQNIHLQLPYFGFLVYVLWH